MQHTTVVSKGETHKAQSGLSSQLDLPQGTMVLAVSVCCIMCVPSNQKTLTTQMFKAVMLVLNCMFLSDCQLIDNENDGG